MKNLIEKFQSEYYQRRPEPPTATGRA
jgi:hypothetical protein